MARTPRRAMSALETLRTTLNAGPTTPPRPRRHDQHNEADVWVCECCAMMVANGDESSCRDYYGHTHPTCDKNIARANIEPAYEVGYFDVNCNGCGSLIRNSGMMHAAIRQLTN